MTKLKRLALSSVVLATALIGAALQPDPIGAWAQEITLDDDYFLDECEGLSGGELTACLATLAARHGDPRFCDTDPNNAACRSIAARGGVMSCATATDDLQRVACETSAAVTYRAGDACLGSIDPGVCLSSAAAELKDPSVIRDNVKDPKERELLLGVYVRSTGDLDVLETIEDPFVHDGILAMTALKAGYHEGRTLDANYCGRIRGGYSKDQGGLSPSDLAAMCGWIADFSNSLLAETSSIEFPADREALEEQALAGLLADIERLERGEIELSDIIPALKDEGLDGDVASLDPEDAARAVAGTGDSRRGYAANLDPKILVATRPISRSDSVLSISIDDSGRAAIELEMDILTEYEGRSGCYLVEGNADEVELSPTGEFATEIKASAGGYDHAAVEGDPCPLMTMDEIALPITGVLDADADLIHVELGWITGPLALELQPMVE